MNDDEIRDALQVIERPVALAPEFTDRVLRAMLAELDAEQPVVAAPSQRRRRPLRWPLRPSLGIAAAVVVAVLAATVVVMTRSAPSAFAALQDARAQFRSLPAYHALTAVSANDSNDSPDFEARWETEDWYRDRDTWRTTILTSNAPVGQPGDYQVLAGGQFGQYQAETNVFTLTPVADRDGGRPSSPAFFFDPSLQWWSTGTPGEPGRPSDEFFEKNCSARDTTYLGRQTSKLHCPAQPRAIDLWLDKETGMLLRISVFDVMREITSIEFNPDAPAGTFEVQAPEGAKKRWGGKGTPPPDYRVALGGEVAARYRVVDGDTAGMMVGAVGRSGIWLVVIRCGQQRCDHRLHRVDPRTGKVLATIEPPHLAFINDVEELNGQIWVSMTERPADSRPTPSFLQQVDLATNRLSGPRIDTGQRGGALVAVDGELWSTGGTTRTVTIGPATAEYQRVARVNPATGHVTQIELAGGASGTPIAGDGVVWVATYQLNARDPYRTDHALVAIDRRTNAVVRRVPAPGSPHPVAFTSGRLYGAFEVFERGARRWLVGVADATAARFTTAPITRGDGGFGPGVLAAGSLWLPSFQQDAVLKVDPGSLRVTAAIVTGRGPSGVGVGLGSVWVANGSDGTLARIDIE